MGEGDFVKWFSELKKEDISIAGGKGASLAEMYNFGIPVPPGFMITAQAYKFFIEQSGLKNKIHEALKDLDINETEKLNDASKKIRQEMENVEFPEILARAITEAYKILDVEKSNLGEANGGALDILRTGHEPPFVAVRSSATAEDLVDASFAGQQESFLNVKGEKHLLKKVRQCFSSLFTPRAIYYRQKKGFKHEETYLAVVVQKMIDSDKSGVMFSRNPLKDDGNVMIEAVWGLGEGIVSGMIKPDNYIVSGNMEEFDVLEMKVAEKKIAITRNSSGENAIIKLNEERSNQQVLTRYELKRLSQYARELEEHYEKPQDIEFAIANKEIYIVQSRPITTKAKENVGDIRGELLLSGLGASPGIGSGVVKIVKGMEDLDKVKPGDVLVTEMTNPDMVVTMQKAAAIVTDEGGITAHAAIVSREMGIPAVVGTGNATEKLIDGQVITVDGSNGKVYEGRVESQSVEIKPVVQTRTKIKTMVDLPDFAERAAKSQVKSLGLVRIEGIIASSGKHPLKYVKEGDIKGYVGVLVSGLKKIARPFEEVWVRSSDIRSDEFRHLEGAVKEVEGNPMLGDHGIRFSLRHPEILKAELTALKELADEFPNKKFGFMAPQIINLNELKEIKRYANEEVGIQKNVKIGVMIETPAAVQIINSLCEEGMDFISFGTNDLTQYTLAVDRNNGDVQYLYDEMNPAVLNSISYVIRRCKKFGVETSICGQAGSKEEMVRFLVQEGIDSISVNPDAVYKISKLVAELEGAEKEVESGVVEAQPEVKEADVKEEIVKERIVEERALEIQNPVIVKEGIDIEEAALQALEEDVISESTNSDSASEIPKLNDAIPIDSSSFIEEKKEEEVDLDSAKEWKSEEENMDEVDKLLGELD